MINKEELLKRFLQYVQIDTGACESPLNAPSSAGQLQLGKLLADQLLQFGLSEVCQTEQGIVYATIPATVTSSEPVICFCAHLDTSPDVPTGPVVPQIISSYNGEDIVFSGDSSKVLSPRDNQDLAAQKGNTIITSDGTTLLGADDKTGVAIIMELARILTSNPQIPHGEIRLCFTCDEELGRGVDHVDLNKIKADFAYTLDSSGVYGIDVETFSADMVTMVIHGRNIHPSIAKGKMINAIKIASRVIADLPSKRLSPETTDSRDGFIHPVELNASVETAIIKFILRSFNTYDLECYLLFLNSIASSLEKEYPGLKIDVTSVYQYRNMGEELKKHPEAVQRAKTALQKQGIEPNMQIVRGGTDGSRLTEMGLPTPNLTSGQHNVHSYLEWASLEEMAATLEWVLEICKVEK